MTEERQPDIQVRDRPDEGAYVIELDGERVGRAEYHVRDGRKIFTHTVVDDEHGGMGLGTTLIEFALEDVRASGDLMVPLCPFFAAYIRDHPDYEEIVDHHMTMELKRLRDMRRD